MYLSNTLEEAIFQATGQTPPRLDAPEWEDFYNKISREHPTLRKQIDQYIAQMRIEKAREVKPPQMPSPEGLLRFLFKKADKKGQEWIVNKRLVQLLVVISLSVALIIFIYYFFGTSQTNSKRSSTNTPPVQTVTAIPAPTPTSDTNTPSTTQQPPTPQNQNADNPTTPPPAAAVPVPPAPPLPEGSASLPPPPDYEGAQQAGAAPTLTQIYKRPGAINDGTAQPIPIYQRQPNTTQENSAPLIQEPTPTATADNATVPPASSNAQGGFIYQKEKTEPQSLSIKNTDAAPNITSAPQDSTTGNALKLFNRETNTSEIYIPQQNRTGEGTSTILYSRTETGPQVIWQRGAENTTPPPPPDPTPPAPPTPDNESQQQNSN